MLLCSSLLLHLICLFFFQLQSVFLLLFFPQHPSNQQPPATQSPKLLPEVRGCDWLISNVPTVMVYIPHSSSSSSSFTPDLNVNPPVCVSSSSPSDSLSREPAAGGLRRRRRPQPLLHGLPVFSGQDALRRPRLRSLPHSLHPWPALQTRSAPREEKNKKNPQKRLSFYRSCGRRGRTPLWRAGLHGSGKWTSLVAAGNCSQIVLPHKASEVLLSFCRHFPNNTIVFACMFYYFLYFCFNSIKSHFVMFEFCLLF